MRVLPCRREKSTGSSISPRVYRQRHKANGSQRSLSIPNYSYLIAGSLLFRDMKMMGELTSGAAARTMLYAKGATEDQAMAYLQPIVIDTHPLNNPWLNYSVYLCNTLIPGVLMLLIFMVTVYSIGVEIKDRTAREWLRMSNNSIYIALAGKLLPPHCSLFSLWVYSIMYTCMDSCIFLATAVYFR